MSNVKIKANASGTADFTIEAPATDSALTLTLPDTQGTLVTDAAGDIERAFSTQIGGRRNLIINGAMQVAQRGTSTTTNGDFCPDRFRNYQNVGTFTSEQSTNAPPGFTYSFKRTNGTGSTASSTEYSQIRYTIEGYDIAPLAYQSADANTVTLSFWAKSSVTGTYIVAVTDSTRDLGIAKSYTISSSDTWEYKTIVIDGYTGSDGTISTTNGSGIQLHFDLGSGSDRNIPSLDTWTYEDLGGRWSHSSQVDWVGTTGATFYITGVQLEVGTVATPFEHRSFGEELALCQRYYWRGNLEGAGYGFVYGTTGNYPYGGGITFPTQMRAQPTCAIVTAPTTINCSVGNSQLLENVHGFIQQLVPASNGMCRANLGVYEADAEL